MNIKRMIWSGVVVIWGLAAWWAISSEFPLEFRFAVVFGFILFCPGLTFVQFLPVSDSFVFLPLGISLSILLSSLVAMVMIWLDAWAPEMALIIIMAVSMLGVVLQIAKEIRDPAIT